MVMKTQPSTNHRVPPTVPQGRSAALFRTKAVRDYLEGRRTAVLPRLILPNRLMILWALLGLIVAAATVGACLTRVPVYASGLAAVGERGAENGAPQGAEAVVLLPPEQLSSLRVGQRMWLRAAPDGGRLEASIVAVEPEVVGSDTANKLFVRGGGAPVATGPAAVAFARIEPASKGPSASLESDGYSADVEIGLRRAISFLPSFGLWSGAGR